MSRLSFWIEPVQCVYSINAQENNHEHKRHRAGMVGAGSGEQGHVVVSSCRKHLLGEHVELHMLVGTINKGISVEGFLTKNLLEPESLYERHDALAAEMNHRGYKHKSPLWAILLTTLPNMTYEKYHRTIDAEASLAELHRRCPECAALYALNNSCLFGLNVDNTHIDNEPRGRK